MITSDLRRAVARAAARAGFDPATDPGLRPTGVPGQYAASAALTLGPSPRAAAVQLAGYLTAEPWIERAEVTGPGYVTVTVTRAALLAVAGRVTAAGPDCVRSDALAGGTVTAAPAGDPLAAPGWAEARAALAARVSARLAAAAGATVAGSVDAERAVVPALAPPECGPAGSRPRSGPLAAEPDAGPRGDGPVAAAVAFAGADAVTFTLARAIPGQPVRVDPQVIARHVPGNPAYAVRYAHARAASGLRWAAASAEEMTSSPGYGESLRRETAVLLDALGWLPERVAAAARRGRPDEFARYLEDLARVTVAELSSARHPQGARAGGSDRLAGARAARTGLAAGLGLLGVSAPDRLLTET